MQHATTTSRALLAALVAGVLATTVGGCGAEVAGKAVRVEPDVSKLDVGNYQTAPREIGNAKSNKQARARESQRLADYVALPYEADPAYTRDVWHLGSHIVFNRNSLGKLVINDTFNDVAKDLVAGWVNSWDTGGAPEEKLRTLSIAVMSFPDANIAASVGPALEHDDFTYNRDNEPVEISKYPHSTAHWRPSVSSIGSWTVQDRYVIFIKIEDNIAAAPDRDALAAQVERMLDVQIPLLGKFQPTPTAELPRIPLDPAGILGRTMPSNPDSPTRPEPDGFYTGRGAVSLFNDPGQDTLPVLDDGQIEYVAFGDAVVFRSRTAAGAERLWQRWQPSKNPKPDRTLVQSPSGLDRNIECYALTSKSGDTERVSYHMCVFQVDRYVVQAAQPQLQQLHQKVSAQYAMLTRR